MVDRAINLSLGPADIELLTAILLDLGKKHLLRFPRCETTFLLPFNGTGADFLDQHSTASEDVLGNQFSSGEKDSWIEVYQALASDMIRGSIPEAPRTKSFERNPGDISTELVTASLKLSIEAYYIL
jgi:hypothetical protein